MIRGACKCRVAVILKPKNLSDPPPFRGGAASRTQVEHAGTQARARVEISDKPSDLQGPRHNFWVAALSSSHQRSIITCAITKHNESCEHIVISPIDVYHHERKDSKHGVNYLFMNNRPPASTTKRFSSPPPPSSTAQSTTTVQATHLQQQKKMSSETLPISNPRFAAALKDLSLASLHLKTLEIRNALAHLAYSNAQLQPFAEGSQPTLDSAAPGQPDPDCVEAIRENEVVMQRMRERIELVRAEVEGRGVSWREFEGPEEVEETEPGVVLENNEEEVIGRRGGGGGSLPLANGMNGHVVDGQDATAAQEEERSNNTTNNNSTSARSGNPWTDGTFQTGVIRNGEVHMDAVPRSRRSDGGATGATITTAPTSTTGGRLTDEDLRRLLEQRLTEDDEDDANEEDEGLHL